MSLVYQLCFLSLNRCHRPHHNVHHEDPQAPWTPGSATAALEAWALQPTLVKKPLKLKGGTLGWDHVCVSMKCVERVHI